MNLPSCFQADSFVKCARLLLAHFVWMVSVGCLFVSDSCCRAEEPYQRFLERLREERMFDLALVYLEDLEKLPNIGAEFKSEYDLERSLLLYQSAALLSPRTPQRVEKLDEAEAALRRFLQQKQQHPRRGEARLKLGELLLTRAEEAKATFSGAAGTEIPEAVKFFDEAHQLFESTIQELAAIEGQLKGARIDPADTKRVAYRDRVRQDLRQAQLLSAKAVDDRGRSRAEGSAERTKDLETALSMFSDLYSKEQRMIGIRSYALFYRSAIQQTLGKTADAIDGFQRIVDQEGVAELRPLQSNATAELIQLLAAEEKFQPAVDRAEKWLGSLQPDEVRSVETMNLKLELARVRIAWAEKLKATNETDRLATRLVRDTRSDLRSMLRVNGPHLDAARELLASLGVDTEEPATEELPTVKDFSEAMVEAQKRIDRAESDALGLAVLEETLADPNKTAEEKKEAAASREEIVESIGVQRGQALTLLREGLRLYGTDDDRKQLYEARFRIAFLLLKLDRVREAIVVGEFLSRTNAGSEQGLQASAIVLGAFSELLRNGDSDKAAIIDELGPFAEYLVETWPQSSEAAAAAGVLTQLSVIAKDWDQAEKFLELVPESSESVAQQRRDLGLSLYVEFLQQERKDGAEGASAKDLKQRAIRWLALAAESVKADDYRSVLDIFNALARMRLSDSKVDEAADLMLKDEKAPIKWLDSHLSEVSTTAAMEAYRTAIQIVAAQVVGGQMDSKAAAASMQGFVDKLQTLAATTPEGEKTLQGIFLAVAQDLKGKLAVTKESAKRVQLSEVMLLVIGEAAKSDSFNTQYWGASTLVSIAEELASDPTGKQNADDAFQQAVQLLQDILARGDQEPGWIQPDAAKMQLRVLLAKSSVGMGDFQGAINTYGEILDDNDKLLDVQIDTANALQAWGRQKAGFYRLAIVGGRPSKKNGGNVIWGWGKIAQQTANQPNFTEQFYEARYQLANCRFRYALSLADPTKKQAEVAKAERDILSTASIYPDLGGAEQRKEYDALLKLIQKELGKPTNGLQGLQ